MKTITLLALLGFLSTSLSAADQQCMSDCTSRYTWALCSRVCSTEPVPRKPYDIAAGQQQANPVGAYLQGRAMRQREQLQEQQRQLLEAQTRQIELQNQQLQNQRADRDDAQAKLRHELQQALARVSADEASIAAYPEALRRIKANCAPLFGELVPGALPLEVEVALKKQEYACISNAIAGWQIAQPPANEQPQN